MRAQAARRPICLGVQAARRHAPSIRHRRPGARPVPWASACVPWADDSTAPMSHAIEASAARLSHSQAPGPAYLRAVSGISLRMGQSGRARTETKSVPGRCLSGRVLARSRSTKKHEYRGSMRRSPYLQDSPGETTRRSVTRRRAVIVPLIKGIAIAAVLLGIMISGGILWALHDTPIAGEA